ncbi:hypothetical protein [Marinilabilia salmonicolor]|uniref:Uncharacterized protein n=1 Tax=Marinilabilia salmonicolor TaxID=989 RepID=A0A368VCF2_9BACT|nr:hypothetical protein [Marinilabilia salmonicolor]RCW38957.1 hypothetical protein DFO77_102111 [Marinilabilia salmonicolor]
MRKQRFYLLIIVTLILGACQKDELTLPASVDVNFNLTPFVNSDIDYQSSQARLKNSSLNNSDVVEQNTPPGLITKMEVFKASFFISDVIIEGIREQGDDVYETIPFDPPLEINLDENKTASQHLSFDIPQGVYKKLEIKLFLGTENHPALEFIGEVTPGKSPTVTFNYQFSVKQEITIRATKKGGRPGDNIILKKNQEEQASLILNADHFFKYFPIPLLAQYKKEELTSDNTINISNKNEKDAPFFTAMSERLEESFSLVFE